MMEESIYFSTDLLLQKVKPFVWLGAVLDKKYVHDLSAASAARGITALTSLLPSSADLSQMTFLFHSKPCM